ncbi:MAG: isochorismatase family protein [Ignavibacteria bacterium]|nr:isochorismatase family protein [Ignavibacteria bacterium]
MRIRRKNSVAVVIDVQEKIFPVISENKILEEKLCKLIKGLKVLGVEILVTEQYTKGLGSTIESVKECLESQYQPLEKMSFSCCGIDTFENKLKESGKNTVIITGIESHVCVLQTVLDLLDKGYIVVVIEDCVSSRNLNDKRTAIKRMRDEGAIITTYESILFEMLEYSGTEEFKTISRIVK